MNPLEPLEYFYDLILSNNIHELRNMYLYDHPKGDPNGTITERKEKEENCIINEKDGSISVIEEHFGPMTYYFSEYLHQVVTKEKEKVVKALDIHLLSINENDRPARIKDIHLIINNLLKSLSEYSLSEKYPVIKASLEEIKEGLSWKYGYQVYKSENANFSTGVQKGASSKIKWNGQINILTTLFYELNTEFFSGEKLIDIPQANLIQFIVENFTDRNGQALEKATIQTYLNNGRPEKRAKAHKKIPIEKIIESLDTSPSEK